MIVIYVCTLLFVDSLVSKNHCSYQLHKFVLHLFLIVCLPVSTDVYVYVLYHPCYDLVKDRSINK